VPLLPRRLSLGLQSTAFGYDPVVSGVVASHLAYGRFCDLGTDRDGAANVFSAPCQPQNLLLDRFSPALVPIHAARADVRLR
jgi:hypothetical protein